MRKLIAIIRKDLILRFTSLSEWLFFLILPVVFTFLLGGGAPSADQDNRIRLAVVDQAQTAFSQQLIRELDESPTVRPDILTLEQAEDQFDTRRVSAVLVLPAGLDMALLTQGAVQLDLRQQPNSLNAMAAERAVRAVIERVSSVVNIASRAASEAEDLRPFESSDARQAFLEQALELAQTTMDESPQRLEIIRGTTADVIDYDPAANASAGQLITWVFIPLLGISGSFAYERTRGTLRRLLTTPTLNATFLLGSIGGNVLTSLVQMVLLVGFGILVMGLNWGRDLLALAAILISFSLASAALGTTLGTFVKSEGQASGLSIMLGMVMALLGGCWYPLELFPSAVQMAVKVLPTTWAMQGMLDLVLRGKGLVDVLPEAGVLLGFALVFFVIGVARFKFE
jgi:ABC-2 type transport system permease protein